jgi:hypothetical protein
VTRLLLSALLAIAAIAQTGIKEKKPVFGGACRLCPWGAMAEVVQAAMKPYGYDVQICYNCNAIDAPRIVADARTPPPYKPDPAMPEILAPRNAPGLGAVDFGAVAIQFLRSAYRRTSRGRTCACWPISRTPATCWWRQRPGPAFPILRRFARSAGRCAS